MPYDGDPGHPIIDKPFQYQIVEFCYHHDPDDVGNSYVDMTLRRGDTLRRLRFLGPQELEIERASLSPPKECASWMSGTDSWTGSVFGSRTSRQAGGR